MDRHLLSMARFGGIFLVQMLTEPAYPVNHARALVPDVFYFTLPDTKLRTKSGWTSKT